MALHPTHANPLAEQYRNAGYWLQQPLGALFAQTAQRYATREAIIDGARRLTFADVDRLSRNLAAALRSLGIGAGDVISYQLPNWWEAVVTFLAAVRIGATVHPLLPIFRGSELRFTLRQSQARALVIPSVWRDSDHRQLVADLRGDLPALEQVVVARGEPLDRMRCFDTLLADSTTVETVADLNADAVALLMYTSGTTAEPKGVLHTHNTLAAEVFSLQRVHQLTHADRTLMPSPLTHISGVIHGILAPVLLGTSAVLMDRWDAARAIDLIEHEHVTYMVGAPTFLQDLTAQAEKVPHEAVASLRLFSCGGAGVAPDLMRRARERFPNCVAKRVYGSTEFPTLTTTDAADALTRGMDTEGRAISPAEVRVADDCGRPMPVGAEGEVQGRGPECFAGYLDPALNADAFAADGWCRTGDLGVLDRSGYLRLTGRLKEIIIRKGEKVSVKELEDLIAAHPAVAEVAVIGQPDPLTGERACAVVRLRPSLSLDLAALTRFLAERGLAKQKWPEQLVIVDDFPRTESGKILRPQLRERFGP